MHLFPGQGDFSVSALVGAVRAEAALRMAAEQVFEVVDEVAGERGLPLLGPWLLGSAPPTARELADAAVGTAQLALFGASMTVHQALRRTHGTPSAAVGVSFGEIAALTAAGLLTLADGARVAHDLARVLASCPGGLTLLGCPEKCVQDLIGRAGAESVVVAVVNDDDSAVIAGPTTGLARVEKEAAQADVTAVRLRLPFTSHHPALQAQSEMFEAALRAYDLGEGRFPVYSAVAGRAYAADDDLPRLVADCLVRPARVPAVLRQAALHSPDVVFEAGTGSALASSARRVLAGHPALVRAPLADPVSPSDR
ncbi:acyltransferase domain-containing protein [Streptomyces sp. S.PB5]|uniref:acyltransferase domain-containing protein n=1 Tax=Streptomyces sp. S.PB5 TaxID=3020844 RepID=UPI0025B0C950|nr:acyltransferase domain-containing protein [Streptomyces sp. S.PB5]MDN3029281.1 acyltransferase domain-containing protein [Streptomyces sp. S.PB5]